MVSASPAPAKKKEPQSRDDGEPADHRMIMGTGDALHGNSVSS